MDLTPITNMITQVGFPIVCCIVLAWYFNKTVESNAQRMQDLQTKFSNAVTKMSEDVGSVVEENQELLEKNEEILNNIWDKIKN